MSVETDDDRSSSELEGSDSGGRTAVYAALEPIRNSFSLQTVMAGFVFLVVGYAIHDGVWPAILAVWGTALVVGGLVAYAFVRWSQRGTRG